MKQYNHGQSYDSRVHNGITSLQLLFEISDTNLLIVEFNFPKEINSYPPSLIHKWFASLKAVVVWKHAITINQLLYQKVLSDSEETLLCKSRLFVVLKLLLVVWREPGQTFIQAIPSCGTGRLHVPVSVTDSNKAKLFLDVSRFQS